MWETLHNEIDVWEADPYDQYPLLLEEKVNEDDEDDENSPDYRANLINNVYGSDEQNAENAWKNAKINWTHLNLKSEEQFKIDYIRVNSIENRIDTALYALDDALSFLKGMNIWKTYAPYTDKAELLAIMSKESSLKLPEGASAAWETGYFQLTPGASSIVKGIIGSFPSGMTK